MKFETNEYIENGEWKIERIVEGNQNSLYELKIIVSKTPG